MQDSVMTVNEYEYQTQRQKLWSQIFGNEEYCLANMSSKREPSSAAMDDANALVDEQVSMARDDPVTGLEDEPTFRKRKLKENAFLQAYCSQEYETTIFDLHNIWKREEGIAEQSRTESERLHFERLFYQLYRLLLLGPSSRFDSLISTYRLADVVRLENLAAYFLNCCNPQHKILAPVFFTDTSESMLLRFREARDNKAQQFGRQSGQFITCRGYAPLGAFATFDEIQDQIEYEFAEDWKNSPPEPKVVW